MGLVNEPLWTPDEFRQFGDLCRKVINSCRNRNNTDDRMDTVEAFLECLEEFGVLEDFRELKDWLEEAEASRAGQTQLDSQGLGPG